MYGNSLLGGVAGVSAGGALVGSSAARHLLGAGAEAGVGAGAGTLPFTGLGLIWFALAAFTLLMAAGALWRMAPRRQA
jgi:hypothetical protein